MEKPDILPCPCCGSPAKMLGSSAFGYQVKYQACGIMTDFISINEYQDMFEVQGKDTTAWEIDTKECQQWCKQKALEIWNTRLKKGQQ